MKLTLSLLLHPTSEQYDILMDTLKTANKACNYISERAFETKTFGRIRLHHLVYYDVRERFGLSAQITVRAIGKVVDAYKVGKKDKKREFSLTGGFPFDRKNVTIKADKKMVSIDSLKGRQKMPFTCSEKHLELLKNNRYGEADLVLQGKKFFLLVSCEVETPPEYTPNGFLGVDLGIANIAVDSDGNFYSGAKVQSIKKRRARQRASLQRTGTKSAKRRLKKISGKEERFVKDTNHRIAKEIVERAKHTGRGIALENLKGIRSRTRVRKAQRYAHHSWSFYQLQQYILYKAKLLGVPVVYVEPAYTSQTCSVCGHRSKSNRKSQSEFVCQSCGHTANADWNAAVNISRRAVVNQPIVSNLPF